MFVCLCDSVMTVIEGITGPNLSKSVCARSLDLSLQVAWCHYWGRSDSHRTSRFMQSWHIEGPKSVAV